MHVKVFPEKLVWHELEKVSEEALFGKPPQCKLSQSTS